jgi:hypothetical protein
MIKYGTIAAAPLGLFGAVIRISLLPTNSDSLGIGTALMPIIFVMAWFFFFCLAWSPCLLVAIFCRPKKTPAADVERGWNIFTASLLPFVVCLCMLVGAIVKNHPSHP